MRPQEIRMNMFADSSVSFLLPSSKAGKPASDDSRVFRVWSWKGVDGMPKITFGFVSMLRAFGVLVFDRLELNHKVRNKSARVDCTSVPSYLL